ncbi:hypothetical protein [Naumannella halotolerans]|uniref:Uncharacterized protein n=1 Tax=Naumannella halotolerans TaxID=993414 RepID=A0A4R7J4J5_9ACTN|nr:hypothetical protein [Naumannella halotolerans]TDT31253.1 hypothetical protein CLV29_2668 [Naumannella halotolerans]
MKKSFGRRLGAGLAGLAVAGAGFVAFGATGMASAGVSTSAIDFDPAEFDEVVEGTTFEAILPIKVTEGGLEQAVEWNITSSDGLECDPEEQSLPADTSVGETTLTKECVVTDGEAETVQVTYEIVTENGTQTGNFGFNPTQPSTPPTSAPTSPPTSAPTSSPSESATQTAAPAPELSIATGTFDPPNAVVEKGGKFEFTKAVTISGAPLTDDLTMALSDFTNLECEPTEDVIEAGSEPGTYEFTFNCEFAAGNEAASGTYTISGGDLSDDIVGTFGYGDIDDDSNDDGNSDDGKSDDDSSSDKSDTEGGLADTGAPAVGVILAGGLAAAAAGGLLMRRRR